MLQNHISFHSKNKKTSFHSPIPIDEVLEGYPYRVSSLSNLDSVEHAGVAQLGQHARHVEPHGGLVGVGLEAAHEPRRAAGHGLQQLLQAVREPGRETGSGRG